MVVYKLLFGLQLIVIISFATADGTALCEEVSCGGITCPYGFSVDVNGCQACQCQDEVCQAISCAVGQICKRFHLSVSNSPVGRCVDPKLPERCQQPMDVGTCRGSKQRYFYDAYSEQCFEFNYGGCAGNQNLFQTQIECERACPTKCAAVMCMMYCENGFKKDHRGCDICVCNGEEDTPKQLEPMEKDFVVGVGCEEVLSCDLHCPYDYQKDEYGCEICKCNVPADCELKECDIECPFGQRTDKNGCPLCECRRMGECNEFACDMYCEFGFKKDRQGCNHCQCKPHPCSTQSCPDGTYCVMSNSTGKPNPTCLMHESWKDNCPEVMCMKNCEFGFKSDIRGCGVCECLEQEKKECPKFMCLLHCDFGFQKNEYGCDVCKCLPNPCDDLKCTDEQVCENVNDCIANMCNHKATCTERSEIKRVKVQLTFSHKKPLNETDMDEFLKNVKKSFAEMLNVSEDDITNIQARRENNSTVHITFHVVKDKSKDLVNMWMKAETHLRTKPSESAITFDGQEFVPQQETLKSSYFSNEVINTDENGGNKTVSIVIACVVIGVILIAICAIVAVYMKKTKNEEYRRKEPIYRKDHAYKKAPVDRSDSFA